MGKSLTGKRRTTTKELKSESEEVDGNETPTTQNHLFMYVVESSVQTNLNRGMTSNDTVNPRNGF